MTETHPGEYLTLDREKVAQQLRPYMSDEDAEKATDGVLRVLERRGLLNVRQEPA